MTTFLAALGVILILGLFFLGGYVMGYVQGGRAMLIEVQSRARASALHIVRKNRDN